VEIAAAVTAGASRLPALLPSAASQRCCPMTSIASSSHHSVARVSGAVNQAFARYDVDRSGSLTKDECVAFIAGKGLAVTRQYLEGVWSVHDKNGDGTLDPQEFASLYSILMSKSDTSTAARISSPEHQERQERARVPAFESETSAPSAHTPAPPANTYFGELARRSRAGEGSREIMIIAFGVLVAVLLLLVVLGVADDTPTEPAAAADDTAGSSAVPPEDEGDENLWWIGIGMSCVACLASAFGYNLVRRAHTLVEERHAAGEEGAKVMDHWQFPIGWFCMVILCAGLDAFALSFTDPALIAPLSGFTLVLNVWVAQLVNGEEVVPLDAAVTSLILAGVIITITNGPSGAVPTVDADYLCECTEFSLVACSAHRRSSVRHTRDNSDGIDGSPVRHATTLTGLLVLLCCFLCVARLI
jgi:hypothetical protein